ncbi:hypothetical protein C8J56DRAFT_920049 [Mycena floridula]|nr:hypothetical protein C8J56DRAFT_920049 [Mycena floridula]
MALWKSTLYYWTTLLRFLEMLLVMNFNIPILLLVVTTLSTAQFFIELRREPQAPTQAPYSPLLGEQTLNGVVNRPRPKSLTPDDIYTPKFSNFVRASEVALELGLPQQDVHSHSRGVSLSQSQRERQPLHLADIDSDSN